MTRRDPTFGDGAASVHLLAALALECAPADATPGNGLSQGDAAMLAERIAADLATFVPDAASLEMVTVGAHYDPVELLRPGWPLHRELEQLAARAPAGAGAGHGRVIAFGSHDGRLPGTLSPSAEFAGGPMRLVPVLLGMASGDSEVLARVGDRFERELLERGMAGAATALLAQESFGLRVEHSRYLTVHDLLAMTALQYEHAGLAPLWPLLETALLSPADGYTLDAPPEPRVAYADGEAHISVPPHADRHQQARQRQFAAVLAAHAIPVTLEQEEL